MNNDCTKRRHNRAFSRAILVLIGVLLLHEEGATQENQTMEFWGIPRGNMGSHYTPVGVGLHTTGQGNSLYGGPITKNNSHYYAEALIYLGDKGITPWHFPATVDDKDMPSPGNGFLPLTHGAVCTVLSFHKDELDDTGLHKQIPTRFLSFDHRRLITSRKDSSRAKKQLNELSNYHSDCGLDKVPTPVWQAEEEPEGLAYLYFKTFRKRPTIENLDSPSGSGWVRLEIEARNKWKNCKIPTEMLQGHGEITVIVWGGGAPIGIDDPQLESR